MYYIIIHVQFTYIYVVLYVVCAVLWITVIKKKLQVKRVQQHISQWLHLLKEFLSMIADSLWSQQMEQSQTKLGTLYFIMTVHVTLLLLLLSVFVGGIGVSA